LNTTLNIGSTSKTFIGVALMQLHDQGKIDLDADINEYLPFKVFNPHFPDIPITLRQLATHTSSIKDRLSIYELKAYYSDDNTKNARQGLPLQNKIHFKRMLKNEKASLHSYLEDVLTLEGSSYSKKNYYKTKPGTKENYTNIGAALAGYIIEIVVDEPYSAYVKKNILDPLSLTSSGWNIADVNKETFAKRYIKSKAVPNYNLITYPDGGLISSTSDLSTYLMHMIKGYNGASNLLSATSFKLMMQNQFEIRPLDNSVSEVEGRSGIFWDIFGQKGEGDIGHSGSDPGILTILYFNPTTGLGSVLTANSGFKKQDKGVIKIWQLVIAKRNSYSSTQ